MGAMLLISKNTLSEFTQYRLNFILWRVRNILKFIIIYFLWWSIISTKNQIFGYDQSTLLTYILISLIVSSIVFSTRTQDVGAEINQGDLSNLLLKPINVFKYWIARDLGDKFLNIGFSVVEFCILVFIFKPPIFLQTNIILLILMLVMVCISIALYFLISLLLSFLGFWTPDVWGPRFLFFIILDFFAGSLFPLDMLPQPIYRILELLPFNYLLFFPIKIYLGQLSYSAILEGMVVALIWVGILSLIVQKVFHKGLLSYGAYGR